MFRELIMVLNFPTSNAGKFESILSVKVFVAIATFLKTAT